MPKDFHTPQGDRPGVSRLARLKRERFPNLTVIDVAQDTLGLICLFLMIAIGLTATAIGGV